MKKLLLAALIATNALQVSASNSNPYSACTAIRYTMDNIRAVAKSLEKKHKTCDGCRSKKRPNRIIKKLPTKTALGYAMGLIRGEFPTKNTNSVSHHYSACDMLEFVMDHCRDELAALGQHHDACEKIPTPSHYTITHVGIILEAARDNMTTFATEDESSYLIPLWSATKPNTHTELNIPYNKGEVIDASIETNDKTLQKTFDAIDSIDAIFESIHNSKE